MPTDREPRAASTAANKKLSPPRAAEKPKVEKKPAPTSTSTKAATKRAHPTYQEMIIQAIEEEGEKGAASRPVIKKYILHRYSLKDTHQFDSLIAAAIRRGSENGTFDLPKGFTGKIKIGKNKDEHHKENAAPNATTAKKPAKSAGTARTKVLSKKTAAAVKPTKAAKKKTTTKKDSTAAAPKKATAKPSASAKKTAKATPAAKPAAAATTSKSRSRGGAKLSPVVDVPSKSSKKTVAAKSVAKKTAAKPKASAAKKPASRVAAKK
ncbi:hypothetical protein JCM16303_001885 [Sporobolomyces ruberrimus]